MARLVVALDHRQLDDIPLRIDRFGPALVGRDQLMRNQPDHRQRFAVRVQLLRAEIAHAHRSGNGLAARRLRLLGRADELAVHRHKAAALVNRLNGHVFPIGQQYEIREISGRDRAGIAQPEALRGVE